MRSQSNRLVVLWTLVLGFATPFAGAFAGALCPKVGFTLVEAHATPETRTLKDYQGHAIFVRRDALTTTSEITEIRLARNSDPTDDDGTLEIKFVPEADQRLHEATTNHAGIRIAFLFNDVVLTNVIWEGTYGTELGGTQVDIHHGLKRARELMKAIQGCTAANASESAH